MKCKFKKIQLLNNIHMISQLKYKTYTIRTQLIYMITENLSNPMFLKSNVKLNSNNIKSHSIKQQPF